MCSRAKMNNILRTITALVALLLATACGGGGITTLAVGEIEGLASLDERQVAEYSVTVSNGENVSYEWTVSIGNAGSFANAKQATATFHANEVTANTSVQIYVHVSGAGAAPALVSREITIIDTNQAPVAAAHCDENRIGDGQEVRFFDDSTDPEGDDDIVKWEWDFEYDGNAGFDPDSELREPVHLFALPGEYQVQLRVTDTSDITDMLDVALSIEVVANIAPVITQVNHSRTTSHAGNQGEAVDLEVVYEDYTPPGGPHRIIWSCNYGYFDDYTSATPKWFPPDDVLECDITVEVIDEFGLLDSGSVHQWTTSFPTINNGAAPGNVIISQPLISTFNGTLNPAVFIHPNDPDNGRVILLSFWATWSGNSVSGIPLLVDVYGTYQNEEDYLHLMTNVGESMQTVSDFVILNSYQGPYWLLDADSSYFTLTNGWNGGSNNLPQTMVFDRDGRCRWAFVGQLIETTGLQLAIDELV